MKYLLLFYFICSLAASGFSQHAILKGVQYESLSTGLEITITIKGGETCQGIRITHGLFKDSAFIQVGHIPGICGSTESESRYTFIHAQPEAYDSNYYRFEFGGRGFSSAVGYFYLPYSRTDVQFFMQKERLTLFAKSTDDDVQSILFYDQSGRLLRQGNFTDGQYHYIFENQNLHFLFVLILYRNGQKQILKLGIPVHY